MFVIKVAIYTFVFIACYKPFFEQIETSLTDPRARRIRRDDAIYGDPPTADRGGD